MLDVVQSRISNVMREDVLLECLQTSQQKTYRIEEIPHDELSMGMDDMLIPVAHFNKVLCITVSVHNERNSSIQFRLFI